MNDCNREKCAGGLQDKARPFREIDLRSADQNTLTARLKYILKRSDKLALCNLLTWIAGRQCKDLLEGFGKWDRADAQCSRMPSHHRPFPGCGLFNVAPNEVSQVRLRFSRKGGSENQDSFQGAGLTIHCGICSFDVVPDLRRRKRDKEAEYDADRGKHARRNSLERAQALADRQRLDDCLYQDRKEIGDAEYNERHPYDGKIVKPVAHSLSPDRI